MKISLKPQKKLNKYKHQNLLYHQGKKNYNFQNKINQNNL